ncbi:MAG: dihydroorotase [Bergeyella sp.]|nr:dihydroorotase [Bergeyella sp.]
MKTLIKNAKIVNEGKIFSGDILIENDRISKISEGISGERAERIIEANGKLLLPGIIDDQVHFREPGLTHKGNIATESRAAIAGGVTSFIDQPNTLPNTVTQKLLEQKYQLAKGNSYANYGFMMGGTNDNIEELLKTNPKNVPAIKLFLGSSTGNMLVDNPKTLEEIFTRVPMLICVHAEDESTIKRNTEEFISRYGEDIPMEYHHLIRSEEACYRSSSSAVKLAERTGARLHVFHISTEKETSIFRSDVPLVEKKITAEVCIHHLHFTSDDYKEKGTLIKWNPAIKTTEDKEGLWKALLEDRIDVIATDHAPHTLEEKQNVYTKSPSGGPLVQHSLQVMLEYYKKGKISLERIVEKMAHNPAILFRIEKRGFIREGYKADLVIVDMEAETTVSRENILYSCGWSPLDGKKFHSKVTHTFVNGHLAYEKGKFSTERCGEGLLYSGI